MTDSDLGALALRHLEQVVAVDSASDETSTTVPTTPGQTELADLLATFFAGHGATVERDEFANIVATFPGVGRGAEQAPVALMVHLDTAPGTVAVHGLQQVPAWRGDPIPYPANPALQVDVAAYPSLEAFRGQTLVHGPGDAPFGLDDKLGLTHLMTLAAMLGADPGGERPPVLLIGRPDEEVGREEALLGLAKTLAERGVDLAYTVDGITSFEVNVENFNAAGATVDFPDSGMRVPAGTYVAVHLGGVNTHGATAKAEGHRPATRFLAEIGARLPASVVPVRFECVVERDCDGTAVFAVADEAGRAALTAATEAVVGPHVPRGASVRLEDAEAPTDAAPGALRDALDYVRRFLADDAVHPVAAEDSEGHQGYSQPFRIVHHGGGVRLSVRLRDFAPEGLAARKARVSELAPDGARVEVVDQYGDMGPRLAGRPELLDFAMEAGRRAGVAVVRQPIRGGTGVDPFLDAGVPVANLGTGYFAPESEKECTTVELMAAHARWLHALVAVILERRS